MREAIGLSKELNAGKMRVSLQTSSYIPQVQVPVAVTCLLQRSLSSLVCHFHFFMTGSTFLGQFQ